MKAPDVLKQKIDMMKEEKLRGVVKEGVGKKDSWSAQQVPRIFHLLHHLIAKSHCKVGDISPILQMREKGPAKLKNWLKVAQLERGGAEIKTHGCSDSKAHVLHIDTNFPSN